MLVVLLSDVVSSHCKSLILFLEFYDTFTSLFYMSSNNLNESLAARIVGRDLSHQCLGKIDPPQEFRQNRQWWSGIMASMLGVNSKNFSSDFDSNLRRRRSN